MWDLRKARNVRVMKCGEALGAAVRADALHQEAAALESGEEGQYVDVWQAVSDAMASPELAVRTAGAAILPSLLDRALVVKGQLQMRLHVPALGVRLGAHVSLRTALSGVTQALEDEDWEVRLSAWRAVVVISRTQQDGRAASCDMNVLSVLHKTVERDMHAPVRQW